MSKIIAIVKEEEITTKFGAAKRVTCTLEGHQGTVTGLVKPEKRVNIGDEVEVYTKGEYTNWKYPTAESAASLKLEQRLEISIRLLMRIAEVVGVDKETIRNLIVEEKNDEAS